MEFVKAKPNEYLIVAKAGSIENLGVVGVSLYGLVNHH